MESTSKAELTRQQRSVFYAAIEPQRLDLGNFQPYKRKRETHKDSGIVPSRREYALDQLNEAGGATVFHGPHDAPNATTVSDEGGTKIGTNVFPLTLQCLFWGNAWTQPATSPSCGDVMRSIITILQSDYFSGLVQYGVTGPFFLFGPAKIIAASEPPNPFNKGDVANIIWSAIDAGVFKEPDDDGAVPALYMVFMPPGVNGPPNTAGQHSVAYDYDFPADVDKQDYGWVLYGGLDSITINFSHELVEALTDPTGDGVQVNPRDSGPNNSWNEIGDVCASSGRVRGVAVTSYFSELDGACIIPTPPPPPPPVLPPADYQINCITRAHHNGNPYIYAVGGVDADGDTPFNLPETAVIDLIVNNDYTFFTNVDGLRANIQIELSGTGFYHLKTVADGFHPNNLENLPHC